MKKILEVEIASVPDRKSLVAEIWWGDEQVAEVSHEDETAVVQIYPQRSGEPWSFGYSDLISALGEAVTQLAGVETKH